MDGRLDIETRVLGSDDQIVSAVVAAEPRAVTIDAPLSLPRGRVSLDKAGPPHFRACDLELRRRRIPFFPISLGPMRLLTARGIRLQQLLRERGIPSEETYPGGAQDILGLPRKQAGPEALREGLRSLGLTGDIDRPDISHDELDAATASLVAWAMSRGGTESIGDPSEGVIVLPRLRLRSLLHNAVGADRSKRRPNHLTPPKAGRRI